jgi:hypothetical protein
MALIANLISLWAYHIYKTRSFESKKSEAKAQIVELERKIKRLASKNKTPSTELLNDVPSSIRVLSKLKNDK